MTVEELTVFTKEKVKQAGMTQVFLAQELGVTKATINHALNRAQSQYNGTRAKILKHLGYKLSDPAYTVEKVY